MAPLSGSTQIATPSLYFEALAAPFLPPMAVAAAPPSKSPSLEAVESFLVAEEDYFRESLAADLSSDRGLRHLRVADELAALVHLTCTMRSADDEAAFADLWKYRVGVGLLQRALNERSFACLLYDLLDLPARPCRSSLALTVQTEQIARE